jgi:hypothetical protein
LLGIALGAFVFLLIQGGIPGLPTSPFGEEPRHQTLSEQAAGAERRILARFPKLRPQRRSAGSDELTVRLTTRDVRDLVLAALKRDPEGRRVLELARAINVEIRDGEIGFQVVVNLEQMPRELLTDQERETIEGVEHLMPILGGDLPIAVYGRPEASHGKLRLGGRPHVEVSIIKLSIGTVCDRLGMSPEELQKSLEVGWPGYEVLAVFVEEGAIELVVRAA